MSLFTLIYHFFILNIDSIILFIFNHLLNGRYDAEYQITNSILQMKYLLPDSSNSVYTYYTINMNSYLLFPIALFTSFFIALPTTRAKMFFNIAISIIVIFLFCLLKNYLGSYEMKSKYVTYDSMIKPIVNNKNLSEFDLALSFNYIINVLGGINLRTVIYFLLALSLTLKLEGKKLSLKRGVGFDKVRKND